VLVELQERDRLALHPDVAAAVDALVRGRPLLPEIRSRDAEGNIHSEKPPTPPSHYNASASYNLETMPFNRQTAAGISEQGHSPRVPAGGGGRISPGASSAARQNPASNELFASDAPAEPSSMLALQPVRIYPYGVARNRLMQAAKLMGLPALVVRNIEEAQVLITLRSYYRDHQQAIVDAEQRGTPIYVLRANTLNQIQQFLVDLFNLPGEFNQPASEDYTNQTQEAIDAVLNGERWVDLPPASATIRRLQHEMARQAQLVSHSYGKEPNRRVRIFRE
jgi:hypothetical protein